MPLITPVLDDRSFEDLFEELRNRIPVYNPQWTDHHDSDVGITLLQLFAALGEGLQYRFNQIPEATYVAYLKLLGIPMRTAAPAGTLLRFENKRLQGVQLYAGDQLKAGKTVFTLRQDGVAWPLDCVTVLRRSLLSEDDLARPDTVRAFIEGLDPGVRATVQAHVDAVREQRGAEQVVAPYETLTLASDGQGEPLDFSQGVDHSLWVAVLAHESLAIAPSLLADPVTGLRRTPGSTLPISLGFSPARWYPSIDEVAACGGGSAPSLQWQASLRAVGPDGQARYLPLRVSGDSTQGFTRQGVVRLELPADLGALGVPEPDTHLAGTGDFPPVLDDERADRLWFWLRVWRGDGSRIGAVQLLSLNTLPCEQVVAAQPQLLGSGDGQPGQAFALASAPVLLDARYPVTLQVEEQGVWQDWTRVDDFDATLAADRHFSVDAESGTVVFASAAGLRVPQLGERVRVLAYHGCDGAAGNVPARAIDKPAQWLAQAPATGSPLLRPTQAPPALSNPLPAYGGLDAETLDQALLRIPTELRRNRRAVTRDDFASLARETPGIEVGRAECLPLFHAPSRGERPGCVSVVLWPARDPQHPDAPVPDAWELSQACQWLDRWRLVTTELYVIPPSYRRIAVSVSVKVAEGHGLDAVRDFVEQVLRQYLAPLPPWGPDGQGWPLGRRVLARELEGVVMQVEGVEYIEALRLDAATPRADGGEDWAAVAQLQPGRWELPALAAVTVVDEATPLPAPGAGLQPPLGTPPVPVPALKDEC